VVNQWVKMIKWIPKESKMIKKIIVLILFGILAYQLSLVEIELEDDRVDSIGIMY